jgi:N-acetylglucosamine-6-phosphate deacetylase
VADLDRAGSPKVLTGADVVTPAGVLTGGWVQLAGDRVVAVGTGPLPSGDVEQLAGGWLLPGFVDTHVHGGGGHDATASPEAMAGSLAFHLGHGTTATVVSLVTAPVRALQQQLSWVADLADAADAGAGPASARVLGAHLEGPFLAAGRCGAQDPRHLLAPDRDVLAELIEAARGRLVSVTLAPELPGALELVDDLVEAGVVVAVGHTDATYDQTRAALDRGATVATHLYNGMRPVHHREPGPVLAALDGGARCEVVNDGVHVHPAVLREVLARGADRLLLVTDAMAAAGAAPGRYRLGGQDVDVADGQARLSSDGALAGSVLTMDAAVRRAVLDGVQLANAATAAATNPAHALGVGDRLGSLVVGGAADLVHLDTELHCDRVLSRGRWVGAAA